MVLTTTRDCKVLALLKLKLEKENEMVENIEFDLTTLGFNVQNTLVPSRTLNRVPTVFV